MHRLATLDLPADIRTLIDDAARLAGVPLQSPLLDGTGPQASAGASNVILFPGRRAARR